MCRSIKPLFNFEPPPGEADVHAAALQYVRKVSGYTRPSKTNEAAFEAAVRKVSAATAELLEQLSTSAPPRDRAQHDARARARRSAQSSSSAAVKSDATS